MEKGKNEPKNEKQKQNKKELVFRLKLMCYFTERKKDRKKEETCNAPFVDWRVLGASPHFSDVISQDCQRAVSRHGWLGFLGVVKLRRISLQTSPAQRWGPEAPRKLDHFLQGFETK